MKTLTKLFTIVLLSSGLTNVVEAQQGFGTSTPAPSSVIDMVATNKGTLLPRVALTSTTVAAPVTAPAHSLTVFNTATTGDVTPGYYYWNVDVTPANSKWVKLSDSKNATASGDVKNSFKTADHSGWFLLDGRAISTLPAAAQAAANALGFSTNLPNATDRVLKTKSTSEIIGSTGGINALTIARANLPNVTFTGTISGTAASNGAHTHTVVTPTRQADTDRGTSNSSLWSIDGTQNSTTTSSGDHTHTVSGSASVPSGGSGATLDNRSPYLVVNTFIFLAN